MILYYSWGGIVANIALIANMFFIMGVLTSLDAVLTLPGIAGIVLTIGIAVDANVLIYERIKEEKKGEENQLLAFDSGYTKSRTTILDANITTLIAALLLFIFGSGPIKGFAITLSFGVVASMFTAIMLTNFLVHFWLYLSKSKVLKI